MNLATVIGPDGRSFVPVVVAASRPFASALLVEWRNLDGVNRGWMLGLKAFNVPAEVFERIAPAVRRRLEREGVAT